jgi:Cft2 family RNA processing exonuclease
MIDITNKVTEEINRHRKNISLLMDEYAEQAAEEYVATHHQTDEPEDRENWKQKFKADVMEGITQKLYGN